MTQYVSTMTAYDVISFDRTFIELYKAAKL